MKHCKLYLRSLILFLAFSTVLFMGYMPGIASAVAVGPGSGGSGGPPSIPIATWVNQGTIQISFNGDTLNFVDPSAIQDHRPGGPYDFSDSNTCTTSDIWADSTNPGSIAHGYIYYQDGSGGNCEIYNLPSNTPIGSSGNANIIYVLSGNTINRIDGASWYSFNQSSSNKNLYQLNSQDYTGGDECRDTIVTSGSSSTATLYELDTNNDSLGQAPSGINADGCFISNYNDDVNGPALNGASSPGSQQCPNAEYCSNYQPNKDGGFSIHLGGSTNNTPGGGGSSATPPATGTGGVSCSIDFNPLTWLVCPIIGLMQAAVHDLSSAFSSLLLINVGTGNSCSGAGNCANSAFGYTNPNTKVGGSNPVYVAWDNVRTISMILLVIIALIMVISQALSVGPFDAYTVKKVLPKLLIAVIAITLSWDICRYIISLVDDLGTGITNILLSPFKGADVITVKNSTLAIGTFAIAGGAATGIIAALAGVFSLGIVFSLVLVIFFSILMSFIVVILRYIVIIALVIFVPIAIIAWILPGTQSIWKLWSSNFIKALLMYPIIMAFLASGVIFGAIISDGGLNIAGQSSGASDTTGTIANVVAIIAVFVPYFFIPATFKMSGAAMGAIGGAFSGLSRNLSGRQKKYRQRKLGEGYQKVRSGDTRPGRSGDLVKRVGLGINAGYKGRYGFGQKGQDYKSAHLGAGTDETLKNNPVLASMLSQEDDVTALMAVGGRSKDDAKAAEADLAEAWGGDKAAKLRAAEAYRKASVIGFGENNQAAALRKHAQSSSRSIPAGRTDLIQAGINRLANGNETLANSLAYTYQYDSRNAQRPDLGGAWHSKTNQDTAAEMVASSGGAISHDQALSYVALAEASGKTDSTTLMRGQKPAVEQTTQMLSAMLQYGTAAQRTEAAQKILSLNANKGYGTDANKAVLNDMLAKLNLHPEGVVSGSHEVTIGRHEETQADGSKIIVNDTRTVNDVSGLADQLATRVDRPNQGGAYSPLAPGVAGPVLPGADARTPLPGGVAGPVAPATPTTGSGLSSAAGSQERDILRDPTDPAPPPTPPTP